MMAMVRTRVRETVASPITIHTTVLPRLTVASLQHQLIFCSIGTLTTSRVICAQMTCVQRQSENQCQPRLSPWWTGAFGCCFSPRLERQRRGGRTHQHTCSQRLAASWGALKAGVWGRRREWDDPEGGSRGNARLAPEQIWCQKYNNMLGEDIALGELTKLVIVGRFWAQKYSYTSLGLSFIKWKVHPI